MIHILQELTLCLFGLLSEQKMYVKHKKINALGEFKKIFVGFFRRK